MSRLFRDRYDGGRHLGERLKGHRAHERLIVLALPRGGVPVAHEVAAVLRVPFDVFVVRKLGLPGHEELAMGAIASGGVQVLVPEVISAHDVSTHDVQAVADRERIELERRERAYRGARAFPVLRGATVVLVDDGIATGASMLAAIRAVRGARPARVIAAAPVVSVQARAMLLDEADEVIAVAFPEPFYGVGAWYDDFSQTPDHEVAALLADQDSRSRTSPLAHFST